MKSVDIVFSSVLERTKPGKSIKKYIKILKLIDAELLRNNIKARTFLGGSVAKNTFLKDSSDCDVFVRFNYSQYKDKNDRLSDILAKVLKRFNPVRIHGSRDYFQFFYEKTKFEVVPVLKIRNPDKALNIMDASPLHVLWFKKHSDEKICDSVRLMKLFCKASGCYGAESFIKGFSGHVIDILTVYYGSFEKILKVASSEWKRKLDNGQKVIIDVEKFYKGKALFNLNKSKTEGPLIVVDPVQKERNAAASLSYEKFKIFIKSAELFLKKPSLKFFEIKEFDQDKIVNFARKKGRFLILVKVLPVRKSEDVAGCKLLKVYNFLFKEILRNDFVIEKKDFYWERDVSKEAIFYFIVRNPQLGDEKIMKGPPVNLKKAVDSFKRVHKRTFVKGNFIFGIEKRKYKSIKKLLNHLFNEDYVKQKVLKVKQKYFPPKHSL